MHVLAHNVARNEARDKGYDEEGISREPGEGLVWLLALSHERGMNRVWAIGIALQREAQATCQMPDAYHEERYQHTAPRQPEAFPEFGLEHDDEEGREKERHGREHCLLEGEGL